MGLVLLHMRRIDDGKYENETNKSHVSLFILRSSRDDVGLSA